MPFALHRELMKTKTLSGALDIIEKVLDCYKSTGESDCVSDHTWMQISSGISFSKVMVLKSMGRTDLSSISSILNCCLWMLRIPILLDLVSPSQQDVATDDPGCVI